MESGCEPVLQDLAIFRMVAKPECCVALLRCQEVGVEERLAQKLEPSIVLEDVLLLALAMFARFFCKVSELVLSVLPSGRDVQVSPPERSAEIVPVVRCISICRHPVVTMRHCYVPNDGLHFLSRGEAIAVGQLLVFSQEVV